MKTKIFLFFAILFPLFVFSQDLKRETLSFDDIKIDSSAIIKIISASRSSKSISDLPLTIYVITREEILANHYVTLVDVLKSLPAMKVSQPCNSDEIESFLMRGLIGNYYAKILINNIPVRPSVISGMTISAQLPIRQAERIEIIYGPASAIYGADATIGVINIITKMPNNVFAQSDITLGTNGYSYFNFSTGGKTGKNQNVLQYLIYGSKMNFENMNVVEGNENVYHRFSYSGEYEDTIFIPDLNKVVAFEKVTDKMVEESPILQYFIGSYPPFFKGSFVTPEINNLPQSSEMLGIMLQYKGLKLSYDYSFTKCHKNIGRSTCFFRYDSPQNFAAKYIQRYSANYSHSIDKFIFNTTLSYLRYRMDNQTSTRTTYNLTPTHDVYFYEASDDFFAEQLITYSPTTNLEFLGGLTFQYSGCLPTTNELILPFNTKNYLWFNKKPIPEDSIFHNFGFNPLLFRSTSVFLQAFYYIGKFTFIGSIRQDKNSNYEATTNPRIAVLFKYSENGGIRTSFGTSFKAPAPINAYYSIAQRDFSQLNTDSVFYEVVPNPDLQPEYFESYEIGVRHYFGKKFAIDISAYYNTIRNLISFSEISVDKKKYPNSSFKNKTTRVFVNSSSAYTELKGLQLAFKVQNIIPSLKFEADLEFNHANGKEVLPGESEAINVLRGMPTYIVQLNLSLFPTKKWYIHLENVMMGEWLHRAMWKKERMNLKFYNTEGFYTLDFTSYYQISRYFRMNLKITNVFDAKYGGIDATGSDVDLRYNPQLGRNIRFGFSYILE